MKRRTELKNLLNGKELVVAPGAHDALTARVIEKCQFPAVYMTGYGQSASHLGRPDIGLMSMTEMVTRARNIAGVVDLPVIADADTGFGNVINVIRTIREYEAANVAAIQLEDQVLPKRCGHMLGREVVPAKEMVAKIKAAVATREDPDLLIVARTDARTNYGIQEALDRARAYEDAGADVLFVESPESVEEMVQINEVLTKPTLANMVEGGRTPLLPNSKLQEIGYNLVIYPTASIFIMAQSMMKLMKHLKDNGSTEELMDQMISFSEFNELVGLDEAIAELKDLMVI
ncbi:isocitrate lyase/PEP mutase family protein [Desulforhopalus singaporensis]|uniref:2-methylisocitrate lyase n=1 Tax=Desulforhopalus singaporensis TaxID=91360 RepID=A0A1H0LTA8_9BACT|nr:isocitrate lyase/phosphoenolpyruvate mutase family protein [Desulforhopalus singaporensis]SDO71499.1 2,3-dimethylmalate lyase [Desulforhopalus singaporensis]